MEFGSSPPILRRPTRKALLAPAAMGAHARFDPSAAFCFACRSASPAALTFSLSFSPIGFRGGRLGTVVLLVDLVGGAGADWDLGGDAGADLDVLEDRVIEEDLGFAFVFLPSVARSVLQRSKRKSIFSPIARHSR